MRTTTSPSTNGTAHTKNGHAPASRLANAAPPLDAVSHGDTAEAKPAAEKPPAEGRTPQGTFAPGNKCARGNPTARKMAALRSALLGNLTPEKMAALGDKLYAAALSGDWTAAKLLLTYAVGKPPDAVDADRLDLDEWNIIDAWPPLSQVLRAFMDGVNPAAAAEFYNQRLRPLVADRLREMLKGGPAAVNGPDVLAEREARVGK